MKRVYVLSGKAVSLQVVAEDVIKVFQKAGFPVVGLQSPNINPRIHQTIQGIVYVFPADPIYALEYAGLYTLFKRLIGDRQVFYTTVEGKLHVPAVNYSVYNYVEFIANSQYTKEKLEEAGFNVIDVVYHGVDPGEVQVAKEQSVKLRKKLEQDFPNKVYFGIVQSGHVRKGWDSFLKALDIVNQKVGDKVAFLVITESSIFSMLEKPNVYIVSEMGRLRHVDVMAFYGAIDFLVSPTYSEGFGLPILEAMSMGTPVIHCWFKPLSEFSLKDVNITFDYDYVDLWTNPKMPRGGILFELHKYDPKALADAIIRAVDLKLNHLEDYTNRKAKLTEYTKKFNIYDLYKVFVDRIRG